MVSQPYLSRKFQVWRPHQRASAITDTLHYSDWCRQGRQMRRWTRKIIKLWYASSAIFTLPTPFWQVVHPPGLEEQRSNTWWKKMCVCERACVFACSQSVRLNVLCSGRMQEVVGEGLCDEYRSAGVVFLTDCLPVSIRASLAGYRAVSQARVCTDTTAHWRVQMPVCQPTSETRSTRSWRLGSQCKRGPRASIPGVCLRHAREKRFQSREPTFTKMKRGGKEVRGEG